MVRRLLSAGVALAVVVAACGGSGGGDDQEDGDDPSVAGATPGDACELLELDEVSELFGEPATVDDSDAGEAPDQTACLWEAATDDEPPIRHQLSLLTFAGGDALDPSAWGDDYEPVDDLGGEAFVVSDPLRGTTAGLSQGQRAVVLTYLVVAADPEAPDPEDVQDEVVELLRAIDSRTE